jgi:histone acetyltransferase
MEHKLESNMYAAMDDFVADANLVFSNCKLFNPEGSVYHKNAKQMERFLKDWLADRKRE